MRSFWTIPFAIAVIFTVSDGARALPVSPQPLMTVAPGFDIELARAGGGHGGGGHGGGGHGGGHAHGGGGHAHSGGGHVHSGGRGGVTVRNRVTVRNTYRVGGRYHGGIWYGTGRHYWRGRWWPYGVGSCWLLSPIGYVWTCG